MKKYVKVIFFVATLCLVIGVVLLVFNKNIYLPGKYYGEISDGLLLVNDGEKYGYYDVEKNKLKIDMKYDLPKDIKDYYNADLTKKDKNLLYPTKFSFQYALNKFNYMFGYIKTTDKNGLYGLEDLKGNVILDNKYNTLNVYDKDLMLVSDEDLYFVNSKGEKLTDKNYTGVYKVNDYLIKTRIDGKYCLLTNKLTDVFDMLFDSIEVFGQDENNYIIETQNDKDYSYYLYSDYKVEKLSINSQINIENYYNNVITYFKDEHQYYSYDVSSKKETYLGNYKSVGKYVNNLAYAVDMNNKLNYIDVNGNTLISLDYDIKIVNDFTKYNLVTVYDKTKTIIINNKGEIISDDYLYSYIVNDKLFIVGKSGLNLVNEKFEPISDEYDTMSVIEGNDKYLLVSRKKDDKEYYGLINYRGVEIVPCKYLEVKVYGDYAILHEKVGKNIIKKLD